MKMFLVKCFKEVYKSCEKADECLSFLPFLSFSAKSVLQLRAAVRSIMSGSISSHSV